MATIQETTTLLVRATGGDRDAPAKLMPLVYDALKSIAQRALAREAPGHTLQATALVHEAYLRLVDQTRVDWKGKTHFMAVSAEVIRRILVDHARARAAVKRGGAHQRVTLAEPVVDSTEAPDPVDLILLDEALKELSELSPRQARVVELRFFAGLSVAETAYALEVSERTVKGDWRVARAWLRARLAS